MDFYIVCIWRHTYRSTPMYIYIYTYLFLYINKETYLGFSVYTCIKSTYPCTSICIHLPTHLPILYPSIYLSISRSTDRSIYVCVCVCIYTYIYIHSYFCPEAKPLFLSSLRQDVMQGSLRTRGSGSRGVPEGSFMTRALGFRF